MRQIFLMICVCCLVQTAAAQSPKRRAEQAAKSRNTTGDKVTVRSQIAFPVQPKMEEDVVWRRDIYREIKLTDDANGGLYFPVEPQNGKVNLFTYIFKLMLRRAITVYNYNMDGNEDFSDSSAVKPLHLLDNYQILYKRTDRGIRIDDSDIPSREVKAYYIKETSYYDQRSATFHTKVLALCPVMEREDDFGDGVQKYPLFWVKYDDLAPYLARQTVMGSSLNNASEMSADDYFAMRLYKGSIYKTNNMLGKTLAQYCANDTAMAQEQKRIEAELAAFENRLWGDHSAKDSLVVANTEKAPKKQKTLARNRRAVRPSSLGKASKSGAASKPAATERSSSARVTVRRERH